MSTYIYQNLHAACMQQPYMHCNAVHAGMLALSLQPTQHKFSSHTGLRAFFKVLQLRFLSQRQDNITIFKTVPLFNAAQHWLRSRLVMQYGGWLVSRILPQGSGPQLASSWLS